MKKLRRSHIVRKDRVGRVGLSLPESDSTKRPKKLFGDNSVWRITKYVREITLERDYCGLYEVEKSGLIRLLAIFTNMELHSQTFAECEPRLPTDYFARPKSTRKSQGDTLSATTKFLAKEVCESAFCITRLRRGLKVPLEAKQVPTG